MKPVKLGVLGTSYHYRLRLQKPIANLPCIETYAIGSRSMDKAKESARKLGFARAYGSYDEVLADPNVEMVYIPLPNNLHAQWMKKCADAGKAVLCEKPSSMNAQESRDAFDYAESKGVLAMEAFMYRFHPQWILAKSLIDIGEIGEVRSIHTVFTYNNKDPQDIRNRMETGGGALYDIGCYAVSSARFLLDREPRRVMGQIDRDPVFGTDTLVTGIMDFQTARAQFTVSTQMAPRQTVSVYGSGGCLILNLPFNAFPDVPLTVKVENSVGVREVKCEPADQYGLMLEAFAKALREGNSAPIPPSDAIANMAVIDACFQSAESGVWETVKTD